MAIFTDVISGNQIVYGGSTISTPLGTNATYSPPQRVIDLPPSGFPFFTEVDSRWIMHGGPGNSGAWEH